MIEMIQSISSINKYTNEQDCTWCKTNGCRMKHYLQINIVCSHSQRLRCFLAAALHPCHIKCNLLRRRLKARSRTTFVFGPGYLRPAGLSRSFASNLPVVLAFRFSTNTKIHTQLCVISPIRRSSHRTHRPKQNARSFARTWFRAMFFVTKNTFCLHSTREATASLTRPRAQTQRRARRTRSTHTSRRI